MVVESVINIDLETLNFLETNFKNTICLQTGVTSGLLIECYI